jgi:hypothetical protein
MYLLIATSSMEDIRFYARLMTIIDNIRTDTFAPFIDDHGVLKVKETSTTPAHTSSYSLIIHKIGQRMLLRRATKGSLERGGGA